MNQTLGADEAKKLVVRVKIQPDSGATAALKDDSEYEWNIPAIIAAVIFIVSLISAGLYFFSSEENVPAEFVTSPQNTVQAPVPEQSSTETITEEIVAENVVIAKSDLESSRASNVESEPVINTIIKEPSKEQEIINAPLVVEEEVVIEAVKAPIEEVVEAVAVAPDSSASPVFTDKVKRAQFTTGIEQREPVDLIEGVFPAKAEGLRQLYFFSELRNLKGHTIRHQWFHEGKLQSEIKFNVRGNRWRVNSSKRLNPAAMGDWEVKVVNEENETLLSKNFQYLLQ